MDEHRKSDGCRGARRSLSPFLRRRLERLRWLRRADDDASLPPKLRRRLEASADCWVRTEQHNSEQSQRDHAQEASGAASVSAGDQAIDDVPTNDRGSAPRAGWHAAAACLLLAIAGWWPTIQNAAHGLTHGISPLQGGVERARVHMIAHGGPHLGKWPWQHESGLAADVQGDVVWDADRQQGYLTLVGLPPNDPATSQYQLWIIDADRDDRYPVDGGVFDVPAGVHQVTVPVRPALRVAHPTMFALTLERAGGVVVSDRSHLVAVARTGAR